MAESSTIEWTDATWQPITGCSIVSLGCTNCYAMKLAGTRLRNLPSRVGLTRPSKAGPVWTGEVRLNEKWLTQPLTWRRPRKIFVCAHGDLFAEGVPDAWIDRVFAVMALCPQHTFQVLTKRSARMRMYMTGLPERIRSLDCDSGLDFHTFLSNVWLGVSAEDQRRADERVPDLLATPAAVRWVSAEPLLGPIDFTRIIPGRGDVLDAIDAVRGVEPYRFKSPWHQLDWIVVGGESGPGARPMHPDWARQIRDACAVAGVSYLFKQWGAWAPSERYPEPSVEAAFGGSRPDVAWPDGTIAHGAAAEHGGLGTSLYRVGKKAAGRLLDGVEHNGMPEVRAA